jgi:integrase
MRRAEASAVLVGDVDERRRSSDPRLRQAIKGSTSWWITVRYGKRGRTRAIPLDEDTLAAITAWVKVRPTAATDHLLLSLPRTGQPPRPLIRAQRRSRLRRNGRFDVVVAPVVAPSLGRASPSCTLRVFDERDSPRGSVASGHDRGS